MEKTKFTPTLNFLKLCFARRVRSIDDKDKKTINPSRNLVSGFTHTLLKMWRSAVLINLEIIKSYIFNIKNRTKLQLRKKTTTSLLVCGFTLVEMLVAIGLFSVVSVVALSSFLSLSTASRYAQSTRALSDSTAFIFEDIIRTMQTASEYRLDDDELILTISDDITDGTDGDYIIYRLGDGVNDEEGVVYKKIDSTEVPLNDANRIKIETLEFNIYEPGSSQSRKKRVALVLKGVFIGANNETQPISLYTTVYQRI